MSHEYFHAMNVKRLRPVELGPFDYEHPPNTTSLWISEGLTSYFGELLVQRSGIATTADALARLSSHIAHTAERTGPAGADAGAIVARRLERRRVGHRPRLDDHGELLRQRARWSGSCSMRAFVASPSGRHTLDDVMRLAYKRYSGERGFTAAQFQSTAEEVAGKGLADFFKSALASTEELDYAEALDWFGLRFAAGEAHDGGSWALELRPDATTAQREHLRAWMPGAH